MSRRDSPPLERPHEPLGRAPRRNSLLASAFSVAAHLMVFAALFLPYAGPPRPHTESPPLQISLIELTKPEPPGAAQNRVAEVKVPEAKRAGPQNAVQPTSRRPAAPVLSATIAPAPDTSDLLSESQLAGAAGAADQGVGGGGSGCDTARIVQQALQSDPLVRTAVEQAHRLGKAVMLWNGDWVRSGEQEGKGLSAVREAITWELAFAPEACRNKQMHGVVLLSLADGSTRFAIGSGDWRWSDLLGVGGLPPYR